MTEAREPVTILKRSASIPLIANIPHSSTGIPSSVRKSFVLDDDELEEELLKMTDWYVDDLFSCVFERDVVTVVYNYSRLVVDPERFADDEQEEMASRVSGVTQNRPVRVT